jgi:hypothetical protein
MGKAGIYNMIIEQGATYTLDITQTEEDGTPVDITGAVVRLGIKDQTTDTVFIKYLDSALVGGITITDAPAGKFSILISAVDTAAMTFNRGVYDLEILYTNGYVSKLLKGRVLVSKEVTDE